MNKITSPSDLRAVLLLTMEGVLEGRVSISQANAVSSISQEVHKSIRQEWDMRCYATENMALQGGEIIKTLLK